MIEAVARDPGFEIMLRDGKSLGQFMTGQDRIGGKE